MKYINYARKYVIVVSFVGWLMSSCISIRAYNEASLQFPHYSEIKELDLSRIQKKVTDYFHQQKIKKYIMRSLYAAGVIAIAGGVYYWNRSSSSISQGPIKPIIENSSVHNVEEVIAHKKGMIWVGGLGMEVDNIWEAFKLILGVSVVTSGINHFSKKIWSPFEDYLKKIDNVLHFQRNIPHEIVTIEGEIITALSHMDSMSRHLEKQDNLIDISFFKNRLLNFYNIFAGLLEEYLSLQMIHAIETNDTLLKNWLSDKNNSIWQHTNQMSHMLKEIFNNEIVPVDEYKKLIIKLVHSLKQCSSVIYRGN